MSPVLKAYVALNTPHFEESVRFYRSFLGADAVRAQFAVNAGVNRRICDGVGPLARVECQWDRQSSAAGIEGVPLSRVWAAQPCAQPLRVKPAPVDAQGKDVISLVELRVLC